VSLRINNGLIVDGTGGPPSRADLAVAGDSIAEIGEISGSADRTIDASGQIICPGFIDIHSHTDYLLLSKPLAESKLLQGVTCEVGGNCGFSAAPLGEEHRLRLSEALAPCQIEVDWEDTDGFLTRLQKAGIGPNFATLAGHGNMRGRVIGYEGRGASPAEIGEMKAEARRALRQGTFGISIGLIYPPGCYADVEELVEIVSAARGKGFFSIHMRDEGAGLLGALAEALEICRRTEVPLQISHHKVTGKKNWGLVSRSVEEIEKARREGLDVTVDVYPYTATNTDLSAVLPNWVKSGGREAMLARLREAAALNEIRQEWGLRAEEIAQWEEYVVSRTFDMENKRKGFEGKRISDICRESKRRPLEVIAGLLTADGGRTEMMRFGICEQDIETVICQSWAMIGSDASAKDFEGDWGHAHPRGFGTFPRLLSEYVKRRGVLSLEEAIRKMTWLPAQRLGLKDRGRIAPGCKADMVIFDFDSIADCATYEKPQQPPQGITRVLVNGITAAKEGELTGARPGHVLRC
jgi:N-acyl-D-amino-acid deacylase